MHNLIRKYVKHSTVEGGIVVNHLIYSYTMDGVVYGLKDQSDYTIGISISKEIAGESENSR